MIKIYDPDETLFTSNGLGNIEVFSCVETKKSGLNGWQIDVVASIKHANLIKQDYLALAETKEHGAQPFRIENPRIENRQIRFTAKHVVFEANKYVLLDSRPTELGAVEYVRWVNGMTDRQSPFTVSGDFTGGSATNYFVRKTLMDALLKAEEVFGCIIDPYMFQIRVMMPESIGSDNGYSVIYGKNLQGITVEEEWSDVCTKLLPVGPDGLLLENPYVLSDVQYDRPYTKVVSFNFDTREEGSTEDLSVSEQRTILAQMAQAYLDEHKVPKVSYTVKSDVPQELKIRDIVHVKHPMLTIDARVTEYKYDCISHKVKSLTFGNYDTSNKSALESRIESVSGAIVNDGSSLISKNQISRYDAGLQRLLSTIANAMGLFKTEEVSSNGGIVYYYHDRPTIAGSNVVYTFNDSGFVVSTDGGQTYNAGIDVHGNAVVNVLSAIGLSADWVESGKLEVKKGNNTVFLADYDTGTVKIVADEFSLTGGSTIQSIAESEANAAISLFASTVLNSAIQNLQGQIDGNIMTWYEQGVPTLANDPAVGWTDTNTKEKHIGDLYYDMDTGKVYIFEKSGNAYSWNLITDSRITDALANASAAQDTADGKRRVFVTQPAPPYDVGDLWCEGSGGDIKTCTTAKASGGSYAASDWSKLNKYTDDTAVTALNSALTQAEIFNRLTNNGAMQGLYMQNGQLYINASYIKSGTIDAIDITGSAITFGSGAEATTMQTEQVTNVIDNPIASVSETYLTSVLRGTGLEVYGKNIVSLKTESQFSGYNYATRLMMSPYAAYLRSWTTAHADGSSEVRVAENLASIIADRINLSEKIWKVPRSNALIQRPLFAPPRVLMTRTNLLDAGTCQCYIFGDMVYLQFAELRFPERAHNNTDTDIVFSGIPKAKYDVVFVVQTYGQSSATPYYGHRLKVHGENVYFHYDAASEHTSWNFYGSVCYMLDDSVTVYENGTYATISS